jgi:hypothetical protein
LLRRSQTSNANTVKPQMLHAADCHNRQLISFVVESVDQNHLDQT